MDAQLNKKCPRGGVLIETLIAGVIMGIVTMALLQLYSFSRDIALESKGSLVAVNALDTVMTYFEHYYTANNPPVTDPSRDPTGSTIFGEFMTFADPNNLTQINKMPEGSRLVAVLGQLNNWKVEYRVMKCDTDSPQTKKYKSRFVTLRMEWDGLRRASGGAGFVKKREEIFSIFTSRAW